MRDVTLICGPPGSGKTTLAHTLGLDVYDIDDEQWDGDEQLLARYLAALAHTPNAQAPVIRAGATRTARADAATLTGATLVITLTDINADECIRRVTARNRPRPPLPRQIAAIREWWARYEPELDRPDDHSRDW